RPQRRQAGRPLLRSARPAASPPAPRRQGPRHGGADHDPRGDAGSHDHRADAEGSRAAQGGAGQPERPASPAAGPWRAGPEGWRARRHVRAADDPGPAQRRSRRAARRARRDRAGPGRDPAGSSELVGAAVANDDARRLPEMVDPAPPEGAVEHDKALGADPTADAPPVETPPEEP